MNQLNFSDCLQQIIAISPNNPKYQQLDLHALIKQVLIEKKNDRIKVFFYRHLSRKVFN